MNKNLLINSLSGTTLYLANIIVAFIMSPIYIRVLGNRDYGLWELVMSVVGFMGILDLGLGGSLVRFVSVADGRQDREDLRQTMSTALAIFVPLGLVAVALFSVLSYSPGWIAGEESRNIANLGTVFVLLGVNAAMIFPLQVFSATLAGLQRHYFLNCVRLTLLVCRASLCYYLLLLYPSHGLLVMALLTPCFTAIQVCLFVGAVCLDDTIPKITLSSVTRKKASELIMFATKNATMLIASRLQNQSVPIIIAHMIGLGQVVYFVLPNRIIDYAKGMSRAIGYPLTPYFGATIGRGNHHELEASWLKTTLALQTVSLAMPFIIFFCGETFLELWIGPEYSEAGRMVLFILLAGLIADSLATNAYSILTAQGRHGNSALMWLVCAVLSVFLGVGGAHFWGVTGVAAGTTVATVIGNLITVTMACSVMRIPLMIYFRRTLLRILPPLLVLATALWAAKSIFIEKSYLNLFFQISIAGLFYLIAIWCYSFSKGMRGKVFLRLRTAVTVKGF